MPAGAGGGSVGQGFQGFQGSAAVPRLIYLPRSGVGPAAQLDHYYGSVSPTISTFLGRLLHERISMLRHVDLIDKTFGTAIEDGRLAGCTIDPR